MTTGFEETIIKEILHGQQFGVLATNGDFGPRTALVAFTVAVDEKSLFFFTPRNTNKYVNIQSEPRVTILMDNRCLHPQREDITALMVTGTCRECTFEERQANRGLLEGKLKVILENDEQALMIISAERFDLVSSSKSLRSVTF